MAAAPAPGDPPAERRAGPAAPPVPSLADWMETPRRLREGARGLLLPLLSWPLWFDVPIELVFNRSQPREIVGGLLGIGLPWLAVSRLRRGRRGDTQRAALIMGAATGLTAGLATGYAAPIAVLLGAGAWLGTRLLYDGAVQEVEPPVPPPPPPEPAEVPAPIREARERLARVDVAADRLADPRLRGVADAMAGVLDDLTARPDRLPMARRFLTVHLDGLERITERLEAGAAPPARLPALMEELTRTAGDLRERLRREETEALDIQVKVLSDRLREEGY